MPLKTWFKRTVLTLAGATVAASALGAHADATLDHVKARGKLVAGVKADYRPFGFLNPETKTIEGFEVDLAKDLAHRLHVGIELVPVQTANRIQFLQQGKIDVLIATLSETPERARLIGIVPTPYYASGGTLLMPKDSPIHAWTDLRGKTVCAPQGSFFTRTVATQYGATIKAFKSSADAMMALRAHNCAASLHDETLAHELVQTPDWQAYAAPLPAIDVLPWIIGVRKGDAPMLTFVDDTVKSWFKSGFLNAEANKWHIEPPSQTLADTTAKH